MFELKNVSKRFPINQGVIKAVDNVSLHINEHEIFGIIGSSGAGKSTLIRCLNLLEVADQGEVIFKGENLLNLSKKTIREKRKKIGMVFQNFNLLNSRTVFDNIAFPIEGLSKSEVREKVLKLLEIVDLSDKVDAYPHTLSGGQKQRVAIARAIVNEPDVILADEPTGALDTSTAKEIMDVFHELNKQGKTIIIVTHDKEVAAQCNRIIEISDGNIV